MCPLCLVEKSELLDQDKHRSFWLCLSCDLVFINRHELISEELEKERYELHENSEQANEYRSYLNKIATSIKVHLLSGDRGMDFGCGKTKVLEELLNPWKVDSFDIYFHPDQDLFSKKYDFIILSEVIEHLRNPRESMLLLSKCLNPNGHFFIKTKLRPGTADEFANWFYKRDITHIQFFNDRSFEKLSQICGLRESRKIGDDLYLFTK